MDDGSGGVPDDTDRPRERLAWEVPETAAVAVLVGVGVLATGGLVAGIVGSGASYGSGVPSRIAVSTAVSFGATWAGPLLAIALLGVVGVCWWQVDAWSSVPEPDDEHDRSDEAASHIRRAHGISLWTLAAFVLVCAGAVAEVVSSALLSSGGVSVDAVNWARVIVEIANLLAVLVVAGVGVWIGRKVTSDGETAG